MPYRTNNKHSLGFTLRRAQAEAFAPFKNLYDFMVSIHRDIRTSEREDFDFFMTRALDPERTRSIFA